MPSGDIWTDVTLQPVVDTLTRVIKPMDIVNLFATGVAASIVIVLVWFRMQMDLWKICQSGKTADVVSQRRRNPPYFF